MTEKDQHEKNWEDLVNVKTERERRIDVVPVTKIHFSTILPRRDSIDKEIIESVRKDGVLVPLIVRPCKEKPEEYEIVDGSVRRLALRDDQYVPVLIMYGFKDSEVLKMRHATFKRKQLTTYEEAEFISRWVRIVVRERRARERDEWGAQAWVARLSRRSEGEISQYLAIHKMFRELRANALQMSEAPNFDSLKNQSINKLYELSKLRDNPALLQVAKELTDHPNISIRTLRRRVRAHKTKMEKPHRRSTAAHT